MKVVELRIAKRDHRVTRSRSTGEFIFLASSALVLVLFWNTFSDPNAYYFTTFVTAPGAVWILSRDWKPRSAWYSRSLYCVMVTLVLLSYRWVFLPYTPANTIESVSVPLPACGSDLQEITAVYTWVNVSDPRWQDLSDRYHCDTTRYRSALGDNDPFDVLRYSMRSVQMNFPYISRFLIVTERDQYPDWLDRGDASVRVIFHDEYMPEGTYPVFNSHPIEYTLYLLKERGFIDTNCFVYLNDDFLIHKPMRMGEVISREGKIVFNTVSHVDLGIWSFIDLPFGAWDPTKSFIVDPHIPYVINTAAFASFMEHCGAMCDRPMRNKCARSGPFPMAQYQTYLAHSHSYLLEFVPPIFGFTIRFPIGAGDMPAWLNRLLLDIINPPFVYLSSHGGLEEDQDYVNMIMRYFNENFHRVGSWEIND